MIPGCLPAIIRAAFSPWPERSRESRQPFVFRSREIPTVRLKMSKNSLFAHLLRSHWWVSIAIALLIAVASRIIDSEKYSGYILSFSFPFVVIGLMAAWKQRHTPSASRVESTVENLATMNWRDFSAVMEDAYRRDGFSVTRSAGAADFKLIKAGRVYLVCCKRWKAATHGLEPLRELEAARKAQDVHEAVYVALGEMSDNARRFAQENRITLTQGPELARLLRHAKSSRQAV